MKNLLECKFNRSYILAGFDSVLSFKVKRRLCELGFTEGQEIKMVRKSLLGKAYLVELRGYTLSLRSDIIEAVLVK